MHKTLHILRNPHDWSEEEKKAASLDAADRIEQWQAWSRDILKWAEEHGLDITSYEAHESGWYRMNDIIERCAKRIEAYGLSLEVQRHIGLPDPVAALAIAVQKIRDLSRDVLHEAEVGGESVFERQADEVVIIDGRLYSQMTDEECAAFVWGDTEEVKTEVCCQRPDRDSPGTICGYPLPCPWHTAIVDLAPDPPTLTIPVTASPPINPLMLQRLKRVANALADEATDG